MENLSTKCGIISYVNYFDSYPRRHLVLGKSENDDVSKLRRKAPSTSYAVYFALRKTNRPLHLSLHF